MGGSKRPQAVIVDATLIKTQRPKKGQRSFYSGKHKNHGIKLQIAIDQRDKNILNLTTAPGNVHDFQLLKRNLSWLHPETIFVGDMGYLGIHKWHARSIIPHKSSKNVKLSKNQIFENHKLSSYRIVVEHVFAYLKSFKILGSVYRNRRKRVHLRSTIIGLLYNDLRCL